MRIPERMMRMYSVYNLLLALWHAVVRPLPPTVLEVARANAVLILALVWVGIARVGVRPMVRAYEEAFPQFARIGWVVYPVLEAGIHVAPLLWLGLPTAAWGFVAALGCMWTWYLLLARGKTHHIYFATMDQKKADALVFHAAPVATMVLVTL